MALDHADRPSVGLARLAAQRYDAVILDVMLPEMDGFEVCRRIRRAGRPGSDIPVLMLTARGEWSDRVVGLELGADDYLPKPCNPRELLARIKAILRRSDRGGVVGGSLAGHRLAFDRWVLDTDRRTLTDDDGIEVALTTAEFRLLTVFLERPRFVLSREQLLDLTSGRAAQVFDRTIDNQISRLRRKIEADPAKPVLIATVWGGGYSLAADVSAMP